MPARRAARLFNFIFSPPISVYICNYNLISLTLMRKPLCINYL